ncbi:flagellar protein FlaG [Clostridium bowmanii]|uniref:flagellar protein FlaG n=1 Tax=Clostridium bowmanii TaxID=132925 RepID=UPI001C0D6C61|nr:flagellar protein FlaG [Clostridium bowmanii]MBU3190709.1 flagellar protein FlaG [Clostridium bowmanii]MCA1075045.1 flagellar protein FlaG [Clostridium bowmanii]
MEIRGVSGNKSMDFVKTHKVTENVSVSKSAENENSLSEKDKGEKEIKNAVSKINKLLEGEGTHLQYKKHDKLNQMIVSVIDNNTNEIINEIPNEKILDMVAEMCEMAGVLVDKKA